MKTETEGQRQRFPVLLAQSWRRGHEPRNAAGFKKLKKAGKWIHQTVSGESIVLLLS